MKKAVSIILSGLVLCSFMGCDSNSKKDSTKDEQSEIVEQEKDGITTYSEEISDANYEEFSKVEIGQTYDDIVNELGEPNQLVKSGEEYTYVWKCENDKAICVVVEDDVVTSKSQSISTIENANVTIDMYNQLEEGMTLEEVKAILGEGVITYEEKINGVNSSTYAYYNENRSSIIIDIRDGVLYSKCKNNID